MTVLKPGAFLKEPLKTPLLKLLPPTFQVALAQLIDDDLNHEARPIGKNLVIRGSGNRHEVKRE
jgi:hypothetical protein